MDRTAHLAAEGHLDELIAELASVEAVYGRLVLAAGPPRAVAWTRNVWHWPETLAIATIGPVDWLFCDVVC